MGFTYSNLAIRYGNPNLDYAEYIGSVYTTTVEAYCSADNEYWPEETEMTALACPIDIRERLRAAGYYAP